MISHLFDESDEEKAVALEEKVQLVHDIEGQKNKQGLYHQHEH